MNAQYPTTAYIYSLFKKYLPIYNGTIDKGLFLLPAQTGSGKTHATIEIIVDILKNYKDKNVIYLINTKKNREEVFHDLSEKIMDICPEFINDLYMLESNSDHFRKFFENYKNIDFIYLESLNEFKALKKKMFTILKFDLSEEEFYNLYKTEDLNLRKRLSKDLAKEDDDSPSIKEVLSLYPTVKITKRVLITTTKKFLNKVFYLPKSKSLYDIYTNENTLIFIDEFDTQKREMLNKFVEDAINKPIDYIALLKIIKERFHDHFIESHYYDERLINLKKELDEFYFKNKFMFRFKLDEIEDKFFLQNSSSIVISKNSKKYQVNMNEEKATNEIQMTDDKLEYKETFQYLHDRAIILINRFLGLVGDIALNYSKIRDIEYTDAITSILFEFISTSDYYLINLLVDKILNNQTKINNDKYFQSYSSMAYNKNYELMAIRNNNAHINFSVFNSYSLNNTPESFLNYLINNFFVVGISATATIKTKIHNFDLEYLENSIISLENSEIEELNKLYLEYKVKDRNYIVNFNQSNKSKNFEDQLKFILKLDLFNEDIAEQILEYAYIRISEDVKYENQIGHELSMYIDFLSIYKKYLLDDNLKKFLYLTVADFSNKNVDLLYYMCILMIKHIYYSIGERKRKLLKPIYSINIKDKEAIEYYKSRLNIYFTNANEQEDDWNKNSNKNTFLVSNFTYMSKGQNISYEDYDLENKRKQKKDFDGIYIGEITKTFITNLNEDEKDILTILFDLTVLSSNGDISKRDMIDYIKKLLNKNPYVKCPYFSTEDFINASMITIIQSIGRLHRTDHQCNLNIYFHEKNKKILQYFEDENQSLLPAVKACITEAKNKSEENINKIINTVSIKDKVRNIKINIMYLLEIFNNMHTSKKEYVKAIESWENLRKSILSNPTKENINSLDHLYSNFKNKKYWFKQFNDYDEIEISETYINGYSEVSFEATRIGELQKIKELKECFEINDIATSFEFNNLPTPIVFNNIYKGAIGEIFGKFILEKFLGINLLNINFDSNLAYESFDYSNENESVYFDFKYYSIYTASNLASLEYIKTIVENKLSRQKNKSLKKINIYVINLFADEWCMGKYSKKIESFGNIHFVPWLISNDEKNNPKIDIENILRFGEHYDKCTNK